MAYTLWFLFKNKHLPQPWFYEPSGTFMDWYSLSYWGHNRGAYDIAGTVYPPISFVLLKYFSIAKCYPNAIGEPSRDCDWVGIVTLTVILLVNVAITFLAFWKHDRRTFFPRAFALSLGFPMLFTYERGNLLLFCYACVVLAFGPLLRSARLRCLFAGMAFNFKVYLVGALVAPLLQRRWLKTEMMLLCAIMVYLATFAIIGEGTPAQVFDNVRFYATQFGSSHVLDLWYPSSLVPIITLLTNPSISVGAFLNSDIIDIIIPLAYTVTRITQLLIAFAAVATWARPEVVPPHRMIFFAIAMAVTTSEVGGYTEILLLFFVFLERWRGWGRPTAISLGYVLCIPAEYVRTKLPAIIQYSWPFNTEVEGEYGLGLFSLARPVIAMLIVWCLTSATLHDVWRDVRVQGWKSRWRFRRDLRLFTGTGEAISPAQVST